LRDDKISVVEWSGVELDQDFKISRRLHGSIFIQFQAIKAGGALDCPRLCRFRYCVYHFVRLNILSFINFSQKGVKEF
jgi:hypothetical protein